ncbi:MAG: long-chain fatty acid--CoA ligase [Candidatus Omnitrophota bacterium]|nr:MAG: long-chain fatty acid--CoA ligase [Candidatus Omnitrophota bacterium]
MDLVHLLEESARKFSWRRCLISAEGNYSYHSLNKEVNQLAFALKEKLGVKKGDKVAILLNNCPQFIIALFAILKAQGVCVPLNVFLSSNELNYVLKDSRSKLLISSTDFLEVLHKLPPKKVILTDKEAPGEIFQNDRFFYWDKVLMKNRSGNPFLAIDPESLALLLYTSGTTGFPKGVMLSHRNIYSNVLASVSALEIKPQERFLLLLPMFHSFTLTVCIFIPIYAGARIAIIKSVRPFQKVLRSVLLNRITIIVGIPQLFDILQGINLPAIFRMFLRVRVCISGAAPLSVETLRRFNEKFKSISLLEGYGLTESAPVVSLNPLRGLRKPGSIGLPLPGVETKIIREDESEANRGETGELIVKGPNIMLGYFNHPEQTKETIKGGWLFTGDMAKIDNDGYIYIVGRKKEMILVHGMNVYPSEIENILKTHPKIKEVAVIGKRDKSKGELLLAFIVLHKDASISEKEIRDYCRGKIANYKIPRLIEFREDLPKTPTGKVLKRKLI